MITKEMNQFPTLPRTVCNATLNFEQFHNNTGGNTSIDIIEGSSAGISLSLYIYIYIYTHTYRYIYIYIYIYIWASAEVEGHNGDELQTICDDATIKITLLPKAGGKSLIEQALCCPRPPVETLLRQVTCFCSLRPETGRGTQTKAEYSKK